MLEGKKELLYAALGGVAAGQARLSVGQGRIAGLAEKLDVPVLTVIGILALAGLLFLKPRNQGLRQALLGAVAVGAGSWWLKRSETTSGVAGALESPGSGVDTGEVIDADIVGEDVW